MPGRRSLQRLARIALGAMLFAQGALAWAGCGTTPHSAAQAIAVAQPLPAALPCHESEEEGLPNANLCLEQCLSGDRSPDTPQIRIDLQPAAFFIVRPLTFTAARRDSVTQPVPLAAPPPRILFLSLRI